MIEDIITIVPRDSSNAGNASCAIRNGANTLSSKSCASSSGATFSIGE